MDSFFKQPFKASKCRTLLKLSIPRIKLLRNRREIQIGNMRREIAKLLETGQEATARIKVQVGIGRDCSKEVASDGCYPPDCKTTHYGASQMMQKSALTGKAIAARNNIVPDSTARKTCLAMFRKLDHKKQSDKKIDHPAAYSSVGIVFSEDYIRVGKWEKNCLVFHETDQEETT